MFDIGLGELVVLAAVALLVFGPDRLPKAAAQAGRFVRDLRAMAASARKELSDSADLGDIQSDFKSIADLHPKRLVSSMLSDPTPDQASVPAPAPTARPASAANPSPPSPSATSSAAGPVAPVAPAGSAAPTPGDVSGSGDVGGSGGAAGRRIDFDPDTV